MSDPTNSRNPSEKPIYIVWIVLFVIGFSLFQYVVLFGLYAAIYGVPTIAELMVMQIPAYSHAVLSKGEVWYSVAKIGPNQASGKAFLRSFNPETGAIRESKLTIPFPSNGFLKQGDLLWVISLNTVTRIDGEQSTEFKPKRTLSRPSEPFLFDNQLAVIDMNAKSPPALLVFRNDQWVDLGEVQLPTTLMPRTDKKNALMAIQVSNAPPARISLLDVQVISAKEKIHLFASDGVNIGYREGIEMAVPSALAPANVENPLEGVFLDDWKLVCPVPPMAGIRKNNSWMACLVDNQPMVLTVASSGGSPFAACSILAYGLQGNNWQKVAEQSSPALIEFLIATDGETTYVAGHSIMQTLRFLKLTKDELQPMSGMLKAPIAGFQPALERWALIYPWIYWIGLLFFVLGIGKLMSWYTDTEYQFGNQTVELASITRRGIARAIDYFLCLIPAHFITIAFGLSNREQVEKDVDKIFDMGPNGLMLRYAWMFLSLLVCSLLILCINCFLQGRWGITTGKWICGIRTQRATLRPCGFLRAVFRELLLYVDFGLGLTCLPGVMMIAFTRNRQRIGDKLADTVVIRRPTLVCQTLDDVI